jgi:hypothetical protein
MLDDFADITARKIWGTNQELSAVDINSPRFSKLVCHLGYEQ